MKEAIGRIHFWHEPVGEKSAAKLEYMSEKDFYEAIQYQNDFGDSGIHAVVYCDGGKPRINIDKLTVYCTDNTRRVRIKGEDAATHEETELPKAKVIRFIDPNYNTLFHLPDGGRIVVTRPMGEMYPGVQEEWVGVCRYLDPTHLSVNSEVLHICQFAEIQQRIGSMYKSEAEPEMIGGYTVNRRTAVGDKVFKMGHSPNAPEPYATWQCFKGENDRNNFGHYWTDRRTAERDHFLRADSERTGTAYDHTTLIKQQKNRDEGAR
jgi:hypothetical protein